MRDPQKIEEFIRECFNIYKLSYRFYFNYFDDEDVIHEQPLVVDGVLQMPLVERAARILGLGTEDLVNMDEDAAFKRYFQYAYLKERRSIEHAYWRSFHDGEAFDSMYLQEVLFNRPVIPRSPTRYDYDDVKQRMVVLLKEMDKSAPGTFHEGASMEHLSIYTENFAHYRQIGAAVESYLAMIDRVKELFFKAWDNDLSEDEMREYNFLVSVLGIRDSCYLREPLHYDLLKLFIPVYKNEGYKEFYSYTSIEPNCLFEPWKCAEFVQDRALVERFLTAYPRAKGPMRRFALAVSKFNCCFIWSDANEVPVGWSDEDIADLKGLGVKENDLRDNELFEGEEPSREVTQILVPKTQAELDGDGELAEQLKMMAGPAGLGGIGLPKLEVSEHLDATTLPRLQARIIALRHRTEGAAR